MRPPWSSSIAGATPTDEDARAEAPGDTQLLTQRPPAARVMRLVERGLFVAGVALFTLLLFRLGPTAVWGDLQMLGWGFALVFAQEAGAFLLNTTGWKFAFPPPRPPVPFRTLLAGRLAGESINNLTPTATIGGEVVRARMLAGVVEPSIAWASVAVAKLMQTFAQMSFIAIGLIIVLPHTPLPDGIEYAMLIGLGLIMTGLLTAIVLQRRGMFSALTGFAARLRIRIPERLHEQVAKLDREIGRFYAAPAAFVLSVLGFFGAWCMGIVEVYIVLTWLDAGPSFTRAATIEVLSVAFDALLFFVPAKAGTQEAGKVLIFTVLGLDPTKGLTLGIARRLRELSWSTIGLIVLARHHARARVR